MNKVSNRRWQKRATESNNSISAVIYLRSFEICHYENAFMIINMYSMQMRLKTMNKPNVSELEKWISTTSSFLLKKMKKKNYYPYLVSARPNNTESVAIGDDIVTHTMIPMI